MRKCARSPISSFLLGAEIASHTSADEARIAGAVEVAELNGSLIVSASVKLVDPWSSEFRQATVALRRWLWPFTVQSPGDAVGIEVQAA